MKFSRVFLISVLALTRPQSQVSSIVFSQKRDSDLNWVADLPRDRLSRILNPCTNTYCVENSTQKDLRQAMISPEDSPSVIRTKIEAQQNMSAQEQVTRPGDTEVPASAPNSISRTTVTPTIDQRTEAETARQANQTNTTVRASVDGDSANIPQGSVPTSIPPSSNHSSGSSNSTTSNTNSSPTPSAVSSPGSSTTSASLNLTCGDDTFDREVFNQNNIARQNPISFIPLLEQRLTKFDGLLYKEAGQIDLLTNEGAAVVRELIEFLKVQQPVPELIWSPEMRPASRDHVLDTGPDGVTGHTGTDGSSPSDRVGKYVTVEGMSGENIAYGDETAQQVIISLMIDDGVPSRGHRSNVFQKQFKKMSSYTGYHKTYMRQTVLNYNGDNTAMNNFMAAPANFPPAPIGATGYSTSSAVEMGDTQFIKTSTRTYSMPGGTEEKKTVVETLNY